MCQSSIELARVSIILTSGVGVGKCVPHLSYYLLQLFSSCKLCKLVSYFKCDTMWCYCRAIFSAECNLSSTYSTPGRVRRFLDCSIRHGECLGIGHKGWKKPTVPSVFLGSEHKLYIVNGGKLALYWELIIYKSHPLSSVFSRWGVKLVYWANYSKLWCNVTSRLLLMQMSGHDTLMQNLVP